MKTKKKIILIIGIVLAILLLLLHLRKRHYTYSLLETSFPAKINGDAPIQKSKTDGHQSAKHLSEIVTVKKMSRLEVLMTEFVGADCCSRLVDQDGQGVSDATVEFSIIEHLGFDSTTKRGTVVSDKNGYFEVAGWKGVEMRLVPRKTGYCLLDDVVISNMEKEPTKFDKNNPKMIHMWRLLGVEPLVQIEKNEKLSYTRDPILIDLVTGAFVSTGGDMRLIIDRPGGEVSPRHTQSWKITFEAIDGGLKKEDDSGNWIVPHTPDEGYVDTITKTVKGGGDENLFFIKSRNGRFNGKLFLSIDVNGLTNEQMRIHFRSAVNTNWSHNLEGAMNW